MSSAEQRPGVRWGRLGIVVAILAAALAYAYFRATRQPDFNTVGGTVLVYEVIPDDPDGIVHEFDDDMVIEVLRQRIPPDIPLSIHRAGAGKIEFRVAQTVQHAEHLERAKALATRGWLELLILANDTDDAEGQEAARQTIAQAKDLEVRARRGVPPPGSVDAGKYGQPRQFEIALPRGPAMVTYRWVELSRQQRQLLELGSDESSSGLKLNQPARLRDPGGQGWLLDGALFVARKCLKADLPEAERKTKNLEFFVLARQSARGPRLDGGYLVEANAAVEQPEGPNDARLTGRPYADMRFNNAGAVVLGQMTKANLPTAAPADEVRRHLAIVLDNQILSAPSIGAEVNDGRARISGEFTKQEVDDLVTILRGGALPCRLRFVEQRTMAPGASNERR